MGEDSCNKNFVDKKSSNFIDTSSKNSEQSIPNSSTMSTCSDVDSSDCTSSFMEDDQDYQYGPGIVSKLRTKFLSITLKQNRGVNCGMRRSCSMENLLDTKPSERNLNPSHKFLPNFCNGISTNSTTTSWSTLKRAKSMDTLLLSLENNQTETSSPTCDTTDCGELKKYKEPKVFRRRDGPLNRSAVTITEEEFPKPDTVKTYKRIFEPSRNSSGNVRRRPPVLRATAKSGSNAISKQGSITNNNKINGIVVSRVLPANKYSAKETPVKDSPPKSVIADDKFKVIESKPKLVVADDKIINCVKTPADEKKFVDKSKVNGVKMLVADEKKVVESVAKVISVMDKSKVNAVKMLVADEKKVVDSIAKVSEKSKFTTVNKIENQTKVVNDVKKVEVLEKKDMIKTSPKKDLACNGTVKAELIQLKVKEEIAKRNNRASKSPDTRNIKPSVPHKKPHLSKLSFKSNTTAHPNAINKLINSKLIKDNQEKKSPSSKNHEMTNGQVVKDKIIPNCVPQTKIVVVDKVTEPVLLNGFTKPQCLDIPKTKIVKDQTPLTNNVVTDSKESKKVAPSAAAASVNNNSMVFDFRGKDVVSHLTVSPAPFGCKGVIRKRSVLIDGKESLPHLNGFANGGDIDSEDEEYIDLSVPPPCGLVFEGENMRIGKGAMLAIRNKDLKIHFDEDMENNTFIYPSESSFSLDDSSLSSSDFYSLDSVAPTKLTNGNSPKLPANTAINNSGSSGLTSYTPSVLRTVDNFQPGLFRAQDDKKKKTGEIGEEENHDSKQRAAVEQKQNGESLDVADMLKPADPEFTTSWSISAGTSDLLF